MWIHHSPLPICWIKIVQLAFGLVQRSNSSIFDERVVLIIVSSHSINHFLWIWLSWTPFYPYSCQLLKKRASHITPCSLKKKKSYFVSPMFTVFVGAAAHMLCTPNARVDQGTRPGQQAAHKWVMTVTLTFGGRAGFGGARECRRSLCLIKQKLINVWFLLASFFEQHIAELICRVSESESESDGATGAGRRKTVCTGGVWKRLSRQYLIFSLNPKWETPGGPSSLINSSWICARI